MIKFKTGDLLDSDADALVNTVNCVGVMGRGIALQFKKAWPDNFKAYKQACDRGEVVPGSMFVFETAKVTGPRFIVNFPTKRHWRNKSRQEDIESGLEDLVRVLREFAIQSIAIPPLGSGLGGLDWNQVRPRIVAALRKAPEVQVTIFEPGGGPRSRTPSHVPANARMTKGRAAMVGLIERYLSGGLDPVVSLLEVHKLLYFLQAAGEPLRLKMKKSYYGPYAENLRHVLHAVEGRFVTGYGDGGDQPGKALELIEGATDLARKELSRQPVTQARFEWVADLVDGFESSFGLELLATTHWVIAEEGARTGDETVKAVYAWSPRKRSMFTEDQIRLARRTLIEQDWIQGEQAAA